MRGHYPNTNQYIVLSRMASASAAAEIPTVSGTEEELLGKCVSKAGELAGVLHEETDTLRKFDSQRLMALLPRKELLSKELGADINSLRTAFEAGGRSSKGAGYVELKTCLEEIDRVNKANKIMIEGSLAYFTDFLEVLYPSNYGPANEGPYRQNAALKGLAFRKEI